MREEETRVSLNDGAKRRVILTDTDFDVSSTVQIDSRDVQRSVTADVLFYRLRLTYPPEIKLFIHFWMYSIE